MVACGSANRPCTNHKSLKMAGLYVLAPVTLADAAMRGEALALVPPETILIEARPARR